MIVESEKPLKIRHAIWDLAKRGLSGVNGLLAHQIAVAENVLELAIVFSELNVATAKIMKLNHVILDHVLNGPIGKIGDNAQQLAVTEFKHVNGHVWVEPMVINNAPVIKSNNVHVIMDLAPFGVFGKNGPVVAFLAVTALKDVNVSVKAALIVSVNPLKTSFAVLDPVPNGPLGLNGLLVQLFVVQDKRPDHDNARIKTA